MEKFQLVFNENEIIKSARKFLELSHENRHFAFYGSMGVGKTTFIKAICQELGTCDLVTSPTFAIVNEYFTHDKLSIYHFDFYRIKTVTELLDIGFDEYCREDAFIFIEWPEKGIELIPDDFIKVYFSERQDGARILKF
jgi:tRNA threonylcarbamoyladenosine biosynthesis protein TsaE